jgi:hypothetical protein
MSMIEDSKIQWDRWAKYDAVKILDGLWRELRAESLNEPYWSRRHDAMTRLVHAIRYLHNPDRYMRPKRGPSAVKTGKSRSKRWDKTQKETPFEKNLRRKGGNC